MASSCAFRLHHLTPEEEATFMKKRLKRLVYKLPSILSILVTWGSTKQNNQSFESFIKTKLGLADKELKKIFRHDFAKLQKTSFDDLDFTFLCQLLPFLCDGIAKMGTEDWKTNCADINKIEHHLQTLKDVRNAIMHEPSGAAVDHTLIGKVQDTLEKLLDIAGHVYSKGAGEIKRAKDEMKKTVAVANQEH